MALRLLITLSLVCLPLVRAFDPSAYCNRMKIPCRPCCDAFSLNSEYNRVTKDCTCTTQKPEMETPIEVSHTGGRNFRRPFDGVNPTAYCDRIKAHVACKPCCETFGFFFSLSETNECICTTDKPPETVAPIVVPYDGGH